MIKWWYGTIHSFSFMPQCMRVDLSLSDEWWDFFLNEKLFFRSFLPSNGKTGKVNVHRLQERIETAASEDCLDGCTAMKRHWELESNNLPSNETNLHLNAWAESFSFWPVCVCVCALFVEQLVALTSLSSVLLVYTFARLCLVSRLCKCVRVPLFLRHTNCG